jgi:predicted nuclease with TOPRIM domain
MRRSGHDNIPGLMATIDELDDRRDEKIDERTELQHQLAEIPGREGRAIEARLRKLDSEIGALDADLEFLDTFEELRRSVAQKQAERASKPAAPQP